MWVLALGHALDVRNTHLYKPGEAHGRCVGLSGIEAAKQLPVVPSRHELLITEAARMELKRSA